LPYIVVVHCYALTKDEGITVSQPSSQTDKLRNPKEDLEAPRYQIDFCGLSAYNILTDADKSIIQGMIKHSKKGVFSTHSRSYGIAALQRMLPVLASDGASADWYEGENPTPIAAPALSPPPKRLRTASGSATPNHIATSTYDASTSASTSQETKKKRTKTKTNKRK